jgi:ribulose-phosphate 3-epimerase
VHIDVFDGHNVPELLFRPDLVVALRKRTTRLIDVHLNVEDAYVWARRFIAAGADMVSVQPGASPDIGATLDSIREQGAQPSLGLEVHETTDQAAALFAKIDRVLLMGTAIGVKGVDLDPATPDRIRQLVTRREQAGRNVTDCQSSSTVASKTIPSRPWPRPGLTGSFPGR